MLVTLTLTDGSEQTLDVTAIRLPLGNAPLELSFHTAPARLRIQIPGTEARWYSLAVYPGAANVVEVEAHVQERDSEPTAG